MKLSIHPGADHDLTDAFRFYKREAGVGVAEWFLAEFERVTRFSKSFPISARRQALNGECTHTPGFPTRSSTDEPTPNCGSLWFATKAVTRVMESSVPGCGEAT